MSRIQNILCLAFFALLSISAQAQNAAGLSAEFPDSHTLKVQRKVDDLFERGEFDRAYFIYRNELVPVGDKYAQYMVGFMHLTGTGVEEDQIAASAWYRLAAERGTPEFVAVRELLMTDITADQRRQSDALFLKIRREYSDLAILLASIKRRVRELQPTTGTRLGSQTSPLTVIDVNSANKSRATAESERRIRRQLQEQLIMLSELGDFPDLETDPTRVDIDDIERLVNQRLQATPDQAP
ncbi:MAG: SEL1-like repeat protein [Gammaproteobacteria bacterium]|nr:SEL1-like repeat protein [Gammaproteobacteria bacterium]